MSRVVKIELSLKNALLVLALLAVFAAAVVLLAFSRRTPANEATAITNLL